MSRLTVLCKYLPALVVLRGLPNSKALKLYSSLWLLKQHEGGSLSLRDLRLKFCGCRFVAGAVGAASLGLREGHKRLLWLLLYKVNLRDKQMATIVFAGETSGVLERVDCL